MRENNLLAVQPRQLVVTTKSDHKLEVYLNLPPRRLKLTGVDQPWMADFNPHLIERNSFTLTRSKRM